MIQPAIARSGQRRRGRFDGINWHDRITIDPKILVGKSVIKGTRLAVEFVMELLAEGWTQEQVLANYPQLQAEDVRAALSYATEMMKDQRLYPLPA